VGRPAGLVPVAGSAATGARLEAAAPAVFALFEGPFLPAEGGESWQLAARQRLTARLHRYAERLGEHWEAAERWAQAGQLYQRMVEIDPLAESFYRRHMLCLRAQGRRAEAIEVFRRCRHSLATTLGVAPGPEVEQVYRELVTS
jgi:DNA-binding SARP family transcriptional activator